MTSDFSLSELIMLFVTYDHSCNSFPPVVRKPKSHASLGDFRHLLSLMEMKAFHKCKSERPCWWTRWLAWRRDRHSPTPPQVSAHFHFHAFFLSFPATSSFLLTQVCRETFQVDPPSPQPSVDRLSVTFRDRSDCSDTSVTVNVFDPGSPPAASREMVTFTTENTPGKLTYFCFKSLCRYCFLDFFLFILSFCFFHFSPFFF